LCSTHHPATPALNSFPTRRSSDLYDKEPEDLLSVAQQIKQLDQEKKDNFKQAGDLMKQADKAESNEEANHLNDRAVALKVTNSKDRKSTRLNSSHDQISYAVFCLK